MTSPALPEFRVVRTPGGHAVLGKADRVVAIGRRWSMVKLADKLNGKADRARNS